VATTHKRWAQSYMGVCDNASTGHCNDVTSLLACYKTDKLRKRCTTTGQLGKVSA
jgi:hypothetical protein